MSRLYSLARQVSEYLRNRFMRRYQELDESVELTEQIRQRGYGKRRGLPERLPDILNRRPQPPPAQPPGDFDPRTGAPPRQPLDTPAQRTPPQRPVPRPSGSPPYEPQPPNQPPPPLRPGYGPPIDPPPPGQPPSSGDGEEEYDDIQLLGRDAGYDVDDFDAIMDALRRTPGSTNVWGYFYERESRRSGILYVTFLRTTLDGKKVNLPGPTYAYYDVPVTKALGFERAAPSSAGGAVWDYLRIRGTVHGHQHQYRLVHVDGEYVPRKASPYGFVNRAVPALGIGRRSYRRNTLSPIRWGRRPNSGRPDRGDPDRGEPDRGDPDRGSPF